MNANIRPTARGLRALIRRTEGVWNDGHLQTMVAVLPFGLRTDPAPEEEHLVIRGGADNALVGRAFWHPGGGARDTVLILPGVGGTAESTHPRRAAIGLYQKGFHTIRLSMRGIADSLPHGRSIHHGGLTEDIRAVAAALANHPRVERLFIFAISLGGNALLKFLGEDGDAAKAHVSAAVTVSSPLDLNVCSTNLEKFSTFPYRGHVLRGLVEQANEFAALYPERALYRVSELAKLRTIREFDAQVIAPMHGFSSAEDYYERASSKHWVSRVAVPTLVIHADDDPMVPARSVEASLADRSAAITAERTQRGGHVGFFAEPSRRGMTDSHAIRAAAAFFRAR